MKIGVLGAGHFAGVVAHCLRLKRHTVVQWDQLPVLLREGQPTEQNTDDGVVVFRRAEEVLVDCDLLWAAYDVPLDTTGRATQINDIVSRIGHACLAVPRGTVVLLSSQWPVGTTARLEAIHPPHTELYRQFVYVLENVRVGRAIHDFLHQASIIVGERTQSLPPNVEGMLRLFANTPFPTPFVVMMPESAELAKQALNAWLGLNIAFINEIGRVAHAVGASADDVARALLGDARVSPTAPLRPGPPFGGGSLQRDILALADRSVEAGLWTPLLHSIIPSNDGGVSPTGIRIERLATLGARLLHTWAGMLPKDGHVGTFEVCPHEDCRAVQ